LIFLGTLEPRKNVPALVRAYGTIASRLPGSDPFPALVLAGAEGWDSAIDGEITSIRTPGVVVKTGYVDRAALPGLLGDAAIVVYPSLGEGFGLPVVEAMACGAVVLTTRELALPEVGGDAVAYTGTSSPEIEEALVALLDDNEKRSQLRKRAIARAGIFTWTASAREHIRAYREALT
jgi:glycosyltransferase involved in cell wall biosynthesis